MNRIPSRAVPAGCAFSLLGIALFIVGAICAWGTFAGLKLPDNHPSASLWPKLLLGAILCFAGGVIVMKFSWRASLQSNMSDPHDREKPKVRW